MEGRNFDIRKNLLEYDDVANDQRKVVYAQRDSLLATDDVSETIADFRAEVVNTIINQFVPPECLKEQWDVKGLERALVAELNEELGIQPLSWESLISVEHTYPEKAVLLDVWIVKDFHGEAHGRERQAVRWVALSMLDQFDFPEANHGIIEALNI